MENSIISLGNEGEKRRESFEFDPDGVGGMRLEFDYWARRALQT